MKNTEFIDSPVVWYVVYMNGPWREVKLCFDESVDHFKSGKKIVKCIPLYAKEECNVLDEDEMEVFYRDQ